MKNIEVIAPGESITVRGMDGVTMIVISVEFRAGGTVVYYCYYSIEDIIYKVYINATMVNDAYDYKKVTVNLLINMGVSKDVEVVPSEPEPNLMTIPVYRLSEYTYISSDDVPSFMVGQTIMIIEELVSYLDYSNIIYTRHTDIPRFYTLKKLHSRIWAFLLGRGRIFKYNAEYNETMDDYLDGCAILLNTQIRSVDDTHYTISADAHITEYTSPFK